MNGSQARREATAGATSGVPWLFAAGTAVMPVMVAVAEAKRRRQVRDDYEAAKARVG
jgi:hypothetical protein